MTPGQIDAETGESAIDELKHITLIGAGTIGLSFAALHLTHNPAAHITIYDTRPDIQSYIDSTLPSYLISNTPTSDDTTPPLQTDYASRLTFATTVKSAVENATIIQEQGPESAEWKQSTWQTIEAEAPRTALLWSSTSGIPASVQSKLMKDKSRLVVVHPYNPPHIMPLLEIVPSPSTSPVVLNRTKAYWKAMDRTAVVLKKECTGFVANRLAFALLKEACGLVNEGVIGVKELDDVITSSMGPRWAVQGVFKSYHAGGGEGGLKAFMEKIGGTVRECWEEGERVKVGPGGREDGWEEKVCEGAEEAYGRVDTGETARLTKGVLEVTKGLGKKKGIEVEEEDVGSKKRKVV